MSRIIKLNSETEIVSLFNTNTLTQHIQKIAPDAEIKVLANTFDPTFQSPIFRLEDKLLAELQRVNQPKTFQKIESSSKPQPQIHSQKSELSQEEPPKKPPKPQENTKKQEHQPESNSSQDKNPTTPKEIRPNPTPPKHHLESVLSKLELLIHDSNLHKDLCEDPKVWSHYQHNTLKKIDSVIKEGRSLKKQETSRIDSWVYHDVRPILDGLAQFFSYACKAEYQKTFSGEALKRDLQARLYGGIGFSLAKLKLLSLQKLLPLNSDYNFFRPRQKIIGRKTVPANLVGKILSIERVGLYHPIDGHLLEEAEVIIGIEAETSEDNS